MKRCTISILTSVGLLATPSALAMWGGGGQVLNSSNELPVQEATVTLECRRNRLFHGSYEVMRYSTTSDEKGRFHFSTFLVWFCSFAYVNVEKAGYLPTRALDLRYSYSSYGEIPEKLHLTPMSEATMQTLKYHVAMSQGVSSSAPHHYLSVHSHFTAATRIARSESEVRYVKASFCPRLISIYQQLKENERSELRKFQTDSLPAPHSYDQQVRSYCLDRNP